MKILWETVLLLAKSWQKNPGTAKVVGSVGNSFLRDNEIRPEDAVDPEFIDRLEIALKPGAQNTQKIKVGNRDDTGHLARIRSLAAAYRVLTGANFTKLLNDAVKKSSLSIQEIADSAGISVGTLHSLRKNTSTHTVPPEKIEQLDRVLNTNKALVEVYKSVFRHEKIHELLISLAGHASFGSCLRKAREQKELTIVELARISGISHSKLNAWELAKTVPPLDQRKEIQHLDEMLGQSGALLKNWENSGPQKSSLQLKRYSLRKEKWPPDAIRHWEMLVDYKTENSEQIQRKKEEGWKEISIKINQEWYERFFGFCLTEEGIPVEDISFLLPCHFPLVKKWANFVRNRKDEKAFSYATHAFVKSLKSLYSSFFCRLWPDLEKSKYWAGRLSEKITSQEEIVRGSGVMEEREHTPKNPKERWAFAIKEAVEKAELFLMTEPMSENSLHGRGKVFSDSKVELKTVAEKLAKELVVLPEDFTAVRTAIYIRRLTIATLLLMRAPRARTIGEMQLKHVIIAGDEVSLDIPRNLVKNERPIKGPLPDVPFVHRLFRIYLLKARPLLLGNNEDEGHFFMAHGGGKLRYSTLYNDAKSVLGVNPHAMRAILVTDGSRRGCSLDELAAILADSIEMVKKHYLKTDAEDKNAVANSGVEGIYNGRKKS